MAMIETTRMIWSTQVSRYRAASTPNTMANTMAMIRPMKVSCSVTGNAWATRAATESLLTPYTPMSPWNRPTM